jgi:hypothetical protein
MVAEVEVDDLRFAGQMREVGPEVGVVVAAGSAVHEDDGRSLAHPRAVGDERRPVDVEPQARPVHVDLHSMPLPLLASDPAQAGDIT